MKVEVDVWTPVPNSPYGLCGRKATLKKKTLFPQCHSSLHGRDSSLLFSIVSSHILHLHFIYYCFLPLPPPPFTHESFSTCATRSHQLHRQDPLLKPELRGKDTQKQLMMVIMRRNALASTLSGGPLCHRG